LGQTWSGGGQASGNYQLTELGAFANGSYNLACMAYSGTGYAQQNFNLRGSDASTAGNFAAADVYSRGRTAQDQYTLSEVGTYGNGSWALGSFTESEQSYTASGGNGLGCYSDSSGTIPTTGVYQWSQGNSADFGMSGNGV